MRPHTSQGEQRGEQPPTAAERVFAEQLLVDLQQQKFDPAFCVMTDEDLKVFADADSAPPLVFLIGPPAIGKTLAMKALPSLLKRKGITLTRGR